MWSVNMYNSLRSSWSIYNFDLLGSARTHKLFARRGTTHIGRHTLDSQSVSQSEGAGKT